MAEAHGNPGVGRSLLWTVVPSATPSQLEIAVRRALPRDEQVRRMQDVLAAPDASTPSDVTMAEICAEITLFDDR